MKITNYKPQDLGIAKQCDGPDHKETVPVKAESTFMSPAITAKDELINWVLTMLGYPLITVELTPSQFDACIADSLELYTKYASFGERYIFVDMNDYNHTPIGSPDNGIDLSKWNVALVKEVSTTRHAMFGYAMGDPFFAWGAMNGNFGMYGNYGMYGMFGNYTGSGFNFVGGLTTAHLAHEFLEACHRITGSNPDFDYDRLHKRLRLYPEPPPPPGKDFAGNPKRKKENWKYYDKTSHHYRPRWMLVTCECEPPVEELYGNNYFKRIVLAKCKILLGTIRSKFQNVQLVGGAQIDTSIKEEGQQELDKILESIQTDESIGQSWFIS